MVLSPKIKFIHLAAVSCLLFIICSTIVLAQTSTLSKVRVSYRPDGGVSITTFLREACKTGESEIQCMDRIYNQNENLKNLPYDDMNPTQLPQDRKDRDKWRGEKGRGIWIDTSLVTKNDKLEELHNKLDQELDKSNPNQTKIIRLQRQIEKLKKLNTSNNLIPKNRLAEFEDRKQSLVAAVVETVTSAVSSAFDGILSSIQNGFLALKQLVTDTLKVGSSEQPAGITVYDQTTKQPFCLVMKDSQLQSIPGECSSTGSSSATENTASSTPDTEPPVITLNGPSSIELEKGTQWADPGATVTDNVNPNIGLTYQVNNTPTTNEGRDLPTIDTNIPGTYTITYTATDEAGNTSTETRTVIVHEPTTTEPTPDESVEGGE